MDISAYSFVDAARRAAKLMPNGGSIITLTYLGSERAIPNYNTMGVAKAALEAATRYIARDLGPQGIRVNAISAGAMRTLSLAGIQGGRGMLAKGRALSALKEDTSMEGVAGCGAVAAVRPRPLDHRRGGPRRRRLPHDGPARRAALAEPRQHRVGHLARWSASPPRSRVRAPPSSAASTAAYEPVGQVGAAQRPAQRHLEATGSPPADWRCPCRRCPAPSRGSARRGRACPASPSAADGSMPSEPVSWAASSDRMSPNRLSVTMTSNWRRVLDQLHGGVVGQHVLQLDVGVLARVQVGDHLAPEQAGLHDVGLLGRGAPCCAGPRASSKATRRDPLDLVGGVDLGVDAAPLAVGQGPRCRAARRNRPRRSARARS